jgi:hypothetical protein
MATEAEAEKHEGRPDPDHLMPKEVAIIVVKRILWSSFPTNAGAIVRAVLTRGKKRALLMTYNQGPLKLKCECCAIYL